VKTTIALILLTLASTARAGFLHDDIEPAVVAAYPGASHPDFFHVTFVFQSGSAPLFDSNIGDNAIERAAWQATYEAYIVDPDYVPGWDGIFTTWRPFMSMTGINAKDHIDIQGPIFNTNGDLVSPDKNTFFHGGANSLVNPIGYDSLGGLMPAGFPVFSGTSNGSRTGFDCSDWEVDAGTYGSVSYTTTTLYDNSAGSCGSGGAIIGISPPIAWPVPEPSTLLLAALSLLGLGYRRRS
jgi:hypothetical protein